MSSQTNTSSEALRTLHRIHRQLGDLKERLVRGPRLIGAHKQNLEKLEAEHQTAKSVLTKLTIATDAKQLQLSSSEEQIKKRRIQLNQASSNAEFQALKDQIAADEMTNSVLADEILEGMEKLDELAEKAAAAKATVAKAREDAEKAGQEIQEKQPLIEADIKRLKTDLGDAEAALRDDFKDLYRRLVRRLGEDALVSVDGRFCSGCNHQIPMNMINDLLLGRPIPCNSCGRLLYLPEGYSTN